MKKVLSLILSVSVILLNALCILPLTAETVSAEDSHRYSFYYAPSDAQLEAGYTYQIMMENTNNPGWQTGQTLGSYGDMVSSGGREVYGFRTNFDFTYTSELWLIMYKDGQEQGRLTFTEVDLNTLNNKVIFPDKSLHDLDEFTYTFAYAPTDAELAENNEYSVSIVNDLWDYEHITAELSRPDSIRYYAFVDENEKDLEDIRRAAVGTITTNLKTTSYLVFIKNGEKYGEGGAQAVQLNDVTLADYDDMVVFPDKSLHELHELVIPQEDPNEGIAPPTGDPSKPELDPVDASKYSKGEGYIRAIYENGDDYEDCEIINFFHAEDPEPTPYRGMSYDIATNTLTLDNVSGSAISLITDGMNSLKVNVIGNCTIKYIQFWYTYPVFTGTGKLNILEPAEFYMPEDAYRAGITPITVEDTVQVTFNANGEEGSLFMGLSSYEDSVGSESIIRYSKASETPAWKAGDRYGGITEVEAYYSGVRFRTVFKASELLKKIDGDNTSYYVKSISHVGNEPLRYHHIYPLVEKDGIWYENSYGSEDNWRKDDLFRGLTAEELAALPGTLSNGDGTVTAYLALSGDYYKAYKKDNKVFLLSYEGRVRNLIVNPSYPIISLYQRDAAPFMMMRVVKEFKDRGSDITLVRYEKEYDLKNSGNEEARNKLLDDEGYETFTKKVFNEYGYSFILTNSSITFGGTAQPVQPSGDNGAAAAEKAKQEAAAAELAEWNGVLTPSIPAAKSVKAKGAKKKVTVSWKKADKKKQKKFNQVEIQICTDKNFAKANTTRVLVGKSKKSKTISGLNSKTTYFVRVRDVSGSGASKQVSKWSSIKKVKTK